MKTFAEKIAANSGPPSKWKEKLKYLQANKWLDYSGEIAVRVLAAIEDKPGMTQAKLAEILGVSPQHISKIVKGNENLTLKTIYDLSQALETDLITFPPFKYSVPLSRKPAKSKSKTPRTTT